MKSPLTLICLLLVSSAFAGEEISIPAPAPATDDAMLAAIAEVETSNNPGMVGSHGERTHLQIMRATWIRYSRLPHSLAASHPQETDRVARAHLADIRRRLKARGVPETPFFIAAAWNVGPGWKVLPTSTIGYAERVANLVKIYQAPSARAMERAPAPVELVPTIMVAASPPVEAMTLTLPTIRPLFRPVALN